MLLLFKADVDGGCYYSVYLSVCSAVRLIYERCAFYPPFRFPRVIIVELFVEQSFLVLLKEELDKSELKSLLIESGGLVSLVLKIYR